MMKSNSMESSQRHRENVMNKRKRRAIIAIFVCIQIMLSGCAGKNITYEYENAKVTEEFVLTKSVYSDDKLEIFISDLEGDYDLTCYDADFQTIAEEFETDYKNGVYTIEGAGTERISGIMLSGNYVRFRIRYLNSSQYAVLCDYEATEIGWVTYGDEEQYYTQDELDRQKAAVDQRNEVQERNFSQFEGVWICTQDEASYLKFYVDDGARKLTWNHSDGQGGYVKEEINVDQINIIDGLFGPELEILDGIDWGCRYSFDLSEDMTMIIDRSSDREDIYFKENNVSEEVSVNKEFFMKVLSLEENRALGAAYAMQKIGAGIIVDATNRIEEEHAYTITLINDSGEEYIATFSESGFIGTIKDKDGELIYYGID